MRSLSFVVLLATLAMLLGLDRASACRRRHRPSYCEPSPLYVIPQSVPAPAMITFAIHGYEGANEAGYGPLIAEFEKRGYLCKIVRSPNTKSKTPHQDRAKVMVEALKHVEGDIVLVGISNHGLFMPLVAAERPIRRIVMINAAVPWPGKSFREAFDFKKVFANDIVRQLAERAPGMSEVCPLKELPMVDYVYVSGAKDDAVRPEWQQWAAREYLHVEAVVVRGAGHANIVSKYAKEVVDASTKGLRRIERR
jgi:hypothetical protein